MTDPRKAYEQSRALEPDDARPAGDDRLDGSAGAVEAADDDATEGDERGTESPVRGGEAPGKGGPDLGAGVHTPHGEDDTGTAGQPPRFTDPTTGGVDPGSDPEAGSDPKRRTAPEGMPEGGHGATAGDPDTQPGTTDAVDDPSREGGRPDDHSPVGSAAGDAERSSAASGEATAHETDDVEALRSALADAERQRDEYLDHLRRERAEFDNFRKRNARERLEAMDRGIQSLLTELLGVLDNFGRVLAAAQDSEDQALAKGAAMVHDELVGVLERFGLESVPGEGSVFDPQWHEAMMQVEAEDDVDEPTVAQVLRSGYRFKGRVLRPASVSVAQ